MDIIIKNFTKQYGAEVIFRDFNYIIEQHKITAILGSSGCGKTTLLNAISGLLDYQGEIIGIPNNVSYVFQEQCLIPNLTVYNNLDYAIKNIVKDNYERTNIIVNALIKVGLIDYKNSYPSALSNGMAQRLSMARAFIYPSELILMDEPFGGLDIGTKAEQIKFFLDMWKESKKTVIFVTHAIDEALEISNKIVVLGKRPVQIIHEYALKSDNLSRDITDIEVFDVRNKIYNLFKQGN